MLVKLNDVFFITKVVSTWNNLPTDTTDFSSLPKFCASVNNDYLLRFVQLICVMNSQFCVLVQCIIPVSYTHLTLPTNREV